MVINNLMDLIKKLFGDNYQNIAIVNSSERKSFKAGEMTVNEIRSYDINNIDMITAGEDKILIIFKTK